MADLARVQIVGNGWENLEAHASVLRHFWSVGITCLDRGELPTLDTDIVVLSDSIPEPERQAWIEKLRSVSPTLLVVRMNGFDSGPHAGADATVDEAHGPGALVAIMYELLTERGRASLNWPVAGEPSWLH